MNELLVWIIFFVFYLIFQVLGNKKRKPGQKPIPLPEQEAPESGERPVTLQDALREIQEALRQAQQPQPPAPTPQPAPEARRELPKPVRREPRPMPASTEFRSLEAPVPREVAETLETRPRPRPRPKQAAAAEEKTLAPIVSPTPTRTVHPITKVFQDPDRLRKIWLMKEILDEPAYKRLRRP